MKALRLLTCVAASAAMLTQLATANVLSGQVKDPSGKPLSDVQVVIPAVQRGARTDASGAYKVDDVPPGSYVVEFRSLSYPMVTQQADLSKGDETLDVAVSGSPLALVPITISAAPKPQSTLTTPATVTVVEGRQLEKQKGQSVMAAIANEPGVSLISEGPTVLKPVIRGLSSQNIVVAEDGVRSESFAWGNEHAPEIDAMGTQSIEVLRGPNSLLYGSDALGGVISVNHAELPNAHLGAGALAGKATVDVESVNKSLGQGVLLSGAQGDWGWRSDFTQRVAGNYRTPGNGTVPNTGEHEANGSGAAIVRKDWGSLGFDYSRFTKRVELQNVDAPGYPDTALNDVEYQVLNHDHGSVRATVNTSPAQLEVITGYDRSDRNEYDQPQAPDNAPTLHWIQTNYTADVKAHHAPLGPVQGTIGFSGLRRVEQSIGTSHLTPGYNENTLGEYIYEELPLGKLTLSAGVRGDQTHFDVGGDDLIGADTILTPVAKQTLNYSAVTGALGAVYHVTEPLAFAVNVGRGYRNPIPFELFAFGEHEGEHVFQVGNASLSPELSWNTDASVRWASERLKGELGVFRNYLHDYIYGTYLPESNSTVTALRGAGVTDPVVQTAQSNATIQGVDFALTGAPLDWLTLKAAGSLVRGYNDNYVDNTLPNHNLPHVPADSMTAGAEVHERALGGLREPYFGMDAHLVRPQRRTGPEDIGTPGYALFGLRTGTEFLVANNRVSLDLGVDNLLDKGYIDYNSLTKFANIQNPGRNVYARVSVPFGS